MSHKPFLKWVGGKTSLLPEIMSRLPQFDTYYELFLGGGALYCHLDLTGKQVVLNDSNEELINCWRVVRDDTDSLIDVLRYHENTKDYFLWLRNLDRESFYYQMSNLGRASRFIFLNKTCFNGLYRVNKKGQMNTPYGYYKNPNWCDENLLRKVSDKLNRENVRLFNLNYRSLLPTDNRNNSFVYFDPPYDILNSTSNFTSYTSGKFDQQSQINLSQQVRELDKIGVKFLMSNSDTPLINDLYTGFIVEKVMCKRSVNCKGDKRGKVSEVLIRNYDL